MIDSPIFLISSTYSRHRVTMKLSIIPVLLVTSSYVSAFTFTVSPSRSVTNSSPATELSLFGGKKDGSGDKGPGMMDQIAMLKKAQEVASKKMAIDKELGKEDFVGSAADGNVKVTIKYVPPLPMQQPSYDGAKVDIDESYLSSASSEELSASVSEAIRDGYKQATQRVAERMTALTQELGDIMGSAAPEATDA